MNSYNVRNNFKNGAIFCLLVMLMAGCAGKNDDLRITEYFDLPEYFTSKAIEYQDKQASLKKTLSRPSDTEVVEKDDVDWMSEFKPFIEIDLNRPAFSNGYMKDTIQTDSGMVITYTARDSTFEIKKVSLSFNDGSLKKVDAIHSKDNVYYFSREILTFEDGKGYEIRVSNVMKAGKPVEFSIRGDVIH